MNAAWLAQSERGSLAALNLIAWVARTLGRGIARALLIPVCGYFVAFAPQARRASRDFLTRVFGKSATLGQIYRHFHVFACTLLDRVEMLTRGSGRFDIHVHDGAGLEAILARGRGCMLIGSHLGSFEILRAYAERQRQLAVNLVMHEDNARIAGRWMRHMAPELAGRVIATGRPETLLRVRDCLERGEIVAMLGDRRMDAERANRCGFLGASASFPSGPMLAAAMLGTPVVAFFCLRRGNLRYDVHFHMLAERIELPAGAREAALQPWIERYVRELESHARAAPYNWFNFYDFWRQQ